jgi:hypothetical protein
MTRIRLTLSGGLTNLWVDRQDDHPWQLLSNGQEYTVPSWLAHQLVDAGHAIDLDAPAAPSGDTAALTIAAPGGFGVWSPSETAALTNGQTVELPASERARLALQPVAAFVA